MSHAVLRGRPRTALQIERLLLLRLPLWLPVWFGVGCDLTNVRSIRAHDKYISLIVISQRIEGNPLTIGGEGCRSVIAAVGELSGGLRIHIDQEDILISGWSRVDEQGLAIG